MNIDKRFSFSESLVHEQTFVSLMEPQKKVYMACATGEFYTDFNSTKTLYSIPDLEHRGDIHGQSEVRSQDSELPNTLNQRPFLDGS